MKIAITGLIGSGKSTVAKIFEEHGYKILDVDDIAHQLIERNDVKTKLLGLFGSKILDRRMKIDRKILAELTFEDVEQMRVLNKIMHPPLKEVMHRILDNIPDDTDVVVDVALLQELEIDKKVDKIILVKSDITNLYERKKEQYSKRQVLNIVNNQLITERYDYLIENDGTLEELNEKSEEVVNGIKS